MLAEVHEEIDEDMKERVERRKRKMEEGGLEDAEVEAFDCFFDYLDRKRRFQYLEHLDKDVEKAIGVWEEGKEAKGFGGGSQSSASMHATGSQPKEQHEKRQT